MSVWLLAPAGASVIALAVLVFGTKLITRALTELQNELQQSSSAAIASDELVRVASATFDHAEQTRLAIDQSLSRFRLRDR